MKATNAAQPILRAGPRRPTEAAFRAFVEPHWPVMERLARRLAPNGQWEEILQDAMLTAWQKRTQFDPDRGTARAWLLAVVSDKAYKRHRRKQVPTAPLTEASTHEPDRSSALDVRAAVAQTTPLPSLDQLLNDDAQCSAAADGAVSDFEAVLQRALVRSRRRRHRGVFVAAATVIAAVAILIVSIAGSTPTTTQHLRLAADYHAISKVPTHGLFYAIGPLNGRRPAGCQKVPHVNVDLERPHATVKDGKRLAHRATAIEIVIHPDKGFRIPHGFENGGRLVHHPEEFPSLLTMPAGRYAMFACRVG